MHYNLRTSGLATVAALILAVVTVAFVTAAPLAATPLAATPLSAETDRSQTVLVVGDSLSAAFGITQEESWVALLGERLQARGYGYGVVNASITGDTTTGGRKRLPRALKLHQPAIVIIELGGNDGLRGTPIEVMRANLEEMIRLAQAAGAGVILAGMQIPSNYGDSYTKAFSAVYPELARKYQTGLVDFFLENVALDIALFQADGIHPTAEAQKTLVDNVWPALETALRDRQPGARVSGQKVRQ